MKKKQQDKKLKPKKEEEEDDVDIDELLKEFHLSNSKKDIQQSVMSKRSNFSMNCMPNHTDILFFGGEYFDGKKVELFNDLWLYQTGITLTVSS